MIYNKELNFRNYLLNGELNILPIYSHDVDVVYFDYIYKFAHSIADKIINGPDLIPLSDIEIKELNND